MKANCWMSPNQVEVQDVPDPSMLYDRDAIVGIASAATCGSGRGAVRPHRQRRARAPPPLILRLSRQLDAVRSGRYEVVSVCMRVMFGLPEAALRPQRDLVVAR
jgi:hypothetical protein